MMQSGLGLRFITLEELLLSAKHSDVEWGIENSRRLGMAHSHLAQEKGQTGYYQA